MAAAGQPSLAQLAAMGSISSLTASDMDISDAVDSLMATPAPTPLLDVLPTVPVDLEQNPPPAAQRRRQPHDFVALQQAADSLPAARPRTGSRGRPELPPHASPRGVGRPAAVGGRFKCL
jgi:hypothetical protein